MTTQIKQPSEDLIYEFDFAPRIGAGTIAAIEDVAVTAKGIVPELQALIVVAQAFEGAAVRLQLAGGTDGETYLVALRARDAVGQIHELEADFVVINFGFAVPELTTPYLTAQAFVERLGIDQAIRITDTLGTGRIEVARLAGALADAQSEVDGYLAARFATPLSTVPALVTTIVFDLAVARLWEGELPQGVRDRRDRAQAQLRDIAKGVVTLPGAATIEAAVTSPEPVLFSAAERLFTRQTLRGF